MNNRMLTLEQLAKITGKSERTLRRVVKESNSIKTDYQNTRLVANLGDVLVHYGLEYNEELFKQASSNQEVDIKLNQTQELVNSVSSLVKQLSDVSKENADMQKALVQKEQAY